MVTGQSVSATKTIESAGSTGLAQIGDNYQLAGSSGGTGPVLKLQGDSRCCGSDGRLGADRCGADGNGISGCLEGRRSGSVHGLEYRQQRQLRHECHRRRVRSQLCPEVVRNELPAGPEWRRDSRSRNARQSSRPGRPSLVQVGDNYQLDRLWRRNRSRPEDARYSRCRGSDGRLGADRRGEDGNGISGCLEGRRQDQYTVWNTDSNGNYVSQCASASCPEPALP